MILILTENRDVSTFYVVDWLNYYGVKHIIINESTQVKLNKININGSYELVLNINNENISFNDITGYWYRRYYFYLGNDLYKYALNEEMLFHLKSETEEVIQYIEYILTKKRCLGSAYKHRVNKLITLNIAREIGFKIPNTLVTTQKEELQRFKKKNKKIITKSIFENPNYEIGGKMIGLYTEIINNRFIHFLPTTFDVSFFQKNIKKKYELRIFYLDGKCYTSAIFSQKDPQTRIDFRKYNLQKPSRNVPYLLPSIIENKIINLMNRLKLDTGSLDIIVDTKDEYYFLEVNPIGQFSEVSSTNNFFIEKEIASYLSKDIKHDN